MLRRPAESVQVSFGLSIPSQGPVGQDILSSFKRGCNIFVGYRHNGGWVRDPVCTYVSLFGENDSAVNLSTIDNLLSLAECARTACVDSDYKRFLVVSNARGQAWLDEIKLTWSVAYGLELHMLVVVNLRG